MHQVAAAAASVCRLSAAAEGDVPHAALLVVAAAAAAAAAASGGVGAELHLMHHVGVTIHPTPAAPRGGRRPLPPPFPFALSSSSRLHNFFFP